jgi:uncharacterized protein YajQ (UPF0234 family)
MRKPRRKPSHRIRESPKAKPRSRNCVASSVAKVADVLTIGYNACHMAKDASFDIVSDFDVAEMTNAVDQTQREIATRFDFRGTAAKLDFMEAKSGVQLEGESKNQLDAILDILQGKLIKRGLSPKTLDTSSNPIEGSVWRWQIKFKKGLDQDKAKQITKAIRDAFPKAKTQIQGDSVRTTSGSRDELQAIIALLRSKDFDYPLDFTNYR